MIPLKVKNLAVLRSWRNQNPSKKLALALHCRSMLNGSEGQDFRILFRHGNASIRLCYHDRINKTRAEHNFLLYTTWGKKSLN